MGNTQQEKECGGGEREERRREGSVLITPVNTLNLESNKGQAARHPREGVPLNRLLEVGRPVLAMGGIPHKRRWKKEAAVFPVCLHSCWQVSLH